MIEGQEVTEITKSPIFCCRSTNKSSLAYTCTGVFFILSMSDTISAMLFLPKLPEDRHGPLIVPEPQFEEKLP
jgi:hypothetical protein